MDLKTLFDDYNCDKSSKHSYHEYYEKEFAHLKDEPINFLEIGTYLGASTQAFHEYFTKATIYTMDIFKRTRPEHLPILKENRVKWLKGDSTNAGLPLRIAQQWGDVEFDIVIDDGAHYPEANEYTFKNIFPMTKGAYYIEDVFPLDKMQPNKWTASKPEEYDIMKYYRFLDTIGKHTVWDNRKNKHPDSYIIKVTK